VGPPAPGTEPAPDPNASAAASEATAATDNTTAAPDAAAAPAEIPEVAGNEMHPEAQIYFAMNGSEPALSTHNPYAAAAEAADPHATMDMFAHEPNGPGLPIAEGEPPGAAAAATAAAKTAESNQPANVEVVFPHDHG
jgi:hypothetical protein